MPLGGNDKLSIRVISLEDRQVVNLSENSIDDLYRYPMKRYDSQVVEWKPLPTDAQGRRIAYFSDDWIMAYSVHRRLGLLTGRFQKGCTMPKSLAVLREKALR